ADAFIASAGVEYNNLSVGASYDFNTSDLNTASNGKGGYELSLIYIIRKVKPLGIKPPCPLY
nr:type IX secretion system membrane protein PorP/SprF [Bacteroidia bacterium]